MSYGSGDSWKHRHDFRKQWSTKPKPKPRKLLMEPQCTFDDLYVSPFRSERRYEVTGGGTVEPKVTVRYVPLEQCQPKAMGIKVLEDYALYVAAGNTDVTAFCEERGLKTADLNSLLFILTGMNGAEFRRRYQVRMMDELLRYTDLTPAEVARRCGLGSAYNLYLTTKREYDRAPVEHRQAIRREGDLGRYRL